MIHTSKDIGEVIQTVRKKFGLTQKDIALTAGTGVRFIIELEKGKPTCEIGKVLKVLQILGIQCHLTHEEMDNAD
ncbi:transcriptional regulator [Legionella rubrilucens]|uniref:Transcriptional regulator n=1 Tax=Legionella rubrilucens TaxID=458 RepID=A0A0W0XVL6_9GAMM|nr:helix-turn-helix transcriptional regulator [Legionella rubrilucens]KTD48849.1 transcriptional regulator [Legionella rubrilucens]